MSEQITYINSVINEMEIKSANNKRIYLNGEINSDLAIKVSYFTNKIINMDSVISNPKKEVTFVINSYGGSVDSGNSIIGNILKLKTLGYKIIAVVEGTAFSMAYDILVNCDKRYGYRYSQYLLHQTGYGKYYCELCEHEREVNYEKRLWELAVEYYIKNTKITRERIDEIYKHKENYFFTADEALENGSIHEIIG